jgi:hypothetical protein
MVQCLINLTADMQAAAAAAATDHDIFDGWGSYPDYLQLSAVFQGLFAVARRFYLLFQQHCRYDNATSISATLGEYSYHQVGPRASFVLYVDL